MSSFRMPEIQIDLPRNQVILLKDFNKLVKNL